VTPDPATAPPRPDLSFLRRRSKPRPAASPVADFIAGRGPHPTHTVRPPAPSAAPPASSSSSLDLSAPAAAPAPTPAPTPAPSSSSLDLSAAPTPPAATPAPARPSGPALAVHRDLRIAAGQQQLLTVKTPTVTLTRVQSGVGSLEIEAVCSSAVGDLRLGAAYELADGTTSTVQYAGGSRFAPSSRRPVIVAGRDEYEHLRLDLRQVRSLRRLAVYAVSESRQELTWGGTLVVSTFGGARIELPLEGLFAGPIAVLMSIYNLDGELVVRAEMETLPGADVRDAARAYGYDRITWRDDRHPVD
jgi:uncharacterized protein involved in tellurium resistance